MRLNSKSASHIFFLATIIALAACSDSEGPAHSAGGESGSGAASDGELVLHVDSPEWEDQIIYLLMTDRFNDGDSANNDQGVGEFDPSKELFYSGGDIQGIIDRLDYIQGLGATVVWPTPLVVNQWISEENQLTGFSGYYAVDFSNIDPHLGDIALYQALSDRIHRRGMYLIQDIVVNHAGLFFSYDAEYDPDDTSKNFRLLEDEGSPQPSPTLPPFDMIDRNNPEHYAAGIYNWTPMIVDYQGLGHRQFTYQLGGLADINTSNPIVIDAFKRIYGDWIETVGVDAFRIDTVRYVEPDFFSEFMHGPDGVVDRAKRTGRDSFLTFGEVLDYSRPFENTGEVALARYLTDGENEILPAVVSFPLKQEIKSVLAQGQPTAQLAYRLEQHMTMYTNPYITPTFVDNHDVPRFLASGTEDAFKQAFALIFTIPGIPTIYQGSAQQFLESRQAMFAGGYLSDRDYFDTSSEMYTFIAQLAELRKSNSALRRGNLEILGSDRNGPGLLAFRRSDENQTLDILINSSDQPIVVDNLDLRGATDASVSPVFSHNADGILRVNNGRLTAEIPGRAFIVLEQGLNAIQPDSRSNESSMGIEVVGAGSTVFEDSFLVTGFLPTGSEEVWLLKNGRVDTARTIVPDNDGRWAYRYPVENLGDEAFYLVAYDPATSSASERVEINTSVGEPTFTATRSDPLNDDVGPSGTYVDMQHPNAAGQKDIVRARVSVGGSILRLELTMKSVTTDWLPPNGFDNVAFSVFFDDPTRALATELPSLAAGMPDGLSWELGHVAYGWGNTAFTPGIAGNTQVSRLSIAPEVEVDKDRRTVTFIYDGSAMGVEDWSGVQVYVTTWDISGEGAYVLLGEEAADWAIGGGPADGPKILDDVLVAVVPDVE